MPLDLELIDQRVRERLVAELPDLAGAVDSLNSEDEIDNIKSRWPSAAVLVRGGRFDPPPGNARHQEAEIDVLVYLRAASVAQARGAAAASALALVSQAIAALSFFSPLPASRLEVSQFGVYRLSSQTRAVFAVHFHLVTEFCS